MLLSLPLRRPHGSTPLSVIVRKYRAGVSRVHVEQNKHRTVRQIPVIAL